MSPGSFSCICEAISDVGAVCAEVFTQSVGHCLCEKPQMAMPKMRHARLYGALGSDLSPRLVVANLVDLAVLIKQY